MKRTTEFSGNDSDGGSEYVADQPKSETRRGNAADYRHGQSKSREKEFFKKFPELGTNYEQILIHQRRIEDHTRELGLAGKYDFTVQDFTNTLSGELEQSRRAMGGEGFRDVLREIINDTKSISAAWRIVLDRLGENEATEAEDLSFADGRMERYALLSENNQVFYNKFFIPKE
jgi:hypothetical protein